MRLALLIIGLYFEWQQYVAEPKSKNDPIDDEVKTLWAASLVCELVAIIILFVYTSVGASGHARVYHRGDSGAHCRRIGWG